MVLAHHQRNFSLQHMEAVTERHNCDGHVMPTSNDTSTTHLLNLRMGTVVEEGMKRFLETEE